MHIYDKVHVPQTHSIQPQLDKVVNDVPDRLLVRGLEAGDCHMLHGAGNGFGVQHVCKIELSCAGLGLGTQ